MKDVVIIVEDNRAFGKSLQKALESSFPDYKLIWYQTGVAAAEAIDHGLRPICGLIDTFLPDTKGPNIARYLLEAVPEAKIIAMTGYQSKEFAGEILRYGAVDYLVKPLDIEQVEKLLDRAIERYKISKKKTLLLQDFEMIMGGGQFFPLNSIFSLVAKLEENSNTLKNISLKITDLAVQLGEIMGIPEADLKIINYTALLHDSGNTDLKDISIYKGVAAKTYSLLLLILKSVRCINEWYNGSGFPNHLKGEDIPVYSRIASVSFGYINLTTDRPIQKAFDQPDALAEIKKYSGTQYDPEIVKALEKYTKKKKS